MYGFRAANRYAKALLSYTIDQRTTEEVFADMQLIHNTVKESKDLERLLISPIVKTTVKKNVLDRVFAQITAPTKRLISLLMQNGRLPLLNQVAERFVLQYNIYKNYQTAVVTTAVPLSSETKTAVLKKVQSLTNNEHITLESKVDPSVIGGFILRVGDVQYNASLAYKIGKLQQRFQEKLFL